MSAINIPYIARQPLCPIIRRGFTVRTGISGPRNALMGMTCHWLDTGGEVGAGMGGAVLGRATLTVAASANDRLRITDLTRHPPILIDRYST